MKDLAVRIFRFDPACDSGSRYETYHVRVNDGARVLHVLHAIHDELDPTLSYRYCCGSGQCGSCAIRVNGQPGLACMKEAEDGMTLDPLDLPIRKDLVVDLVPTLSLLPAIEPAPEFRMPTREEVEAMKPLRSCIGCLSCISACPALKVADFAGPTAMRQEMRLALDPRDTRDRIAEAIERGLFHCTTCQKCVEVCPKEIRTPGKAVEKLRELANRRGLTMPRHQEVAKLIEETGRSVARTGPTFIEQVPEVVEPYGEVRGEMGFFVGCMYNGRLPETALDMIEVMRRNGIRVIIPREQVCCGSPLIRTGQTSFVKTLMQRNIDAFTFRGIKTVMTMCAGCGSTLKNDYETPFEVLDVTEVLARYGIEPPLPLHVRATFHDPCHLLRGQGIAKQPRDLLRMAVEEFVEMPAQCCGAGGGVRSGIPEEAAALGKERGSEIARTGADLVVTACPFCEFHIREQTDKPVRHIASVLLDGYREKDRKSAESAKTGS